MLPVVLVLHQLKLVARLTVSRSAFVSCIYQVYMYIHAIFPEDYLEIALEFCNRV